MLPFKNDFSQKNSKCIDTFIDFSRKLHFEFEKHILLQNLNNKI